MSEESLASAVILQAIEDLRRPEPAKRPDKESRAYYEAWKRERTEAIRFLTAETGDWAKSRAEWCALAGIEASRVRTQALNMIGQAA
jgi:hypothetical protein